MADDNNSVLVYADLMKRFVHVAGRVLADRTGAAYRTATVTVAGRTTPPRATPFGAEFGVEGDPGRQFVEDMETFYRLDMALPRKNICDRPYLDEGW